MSRLSAELHIHSCLSPCADDDMTPANIAGMAMIAGLDIAALTDHNTTDNCPAFFAACEQYGIVPIGGMELTTSEEIHMVCLFETLMQTVEFGKEIKKHWANVPNRPKFFGNQLLMDETDQLIGNEPCLLLTATDLSLEDAAKLVEKFGGVAYPAHIDRDSGGLIAILGTMPKEIGFKTAELRDGESAKEYSKREDTKDLMFVTASDAHQLGNIGDAPYGLELDCEEDSRTHKRAQCIRSALIKRLKQGLL